MTGLLLPPWRVAVSLPGVRMAVLLAAGGPVFVAWAGEEADTGFRLLLVGLAAGVALALVWDDGCAPLTAATPTGLPSVRAGRAAALLATLVAGWGASALVADRAVPSTPVLATTVPVLALAVLLVAAVGLIARGREGEPIRAYPVPVLLLVVVLLSRLPERWSLLVTPTAGDWPQARNRWQVLLVGSVGTVLWLARDPASRPWRRRRPSSART